MDDQQNLGSQSLKERAWTTEEIRKHSSNWTLAGDVGLFNLLNEFSHHIISRTHEVENAVDSLVHQTKMTSAKVNNVINDFHMLSNLQFVENRVYDEEVHEPVTENKPTAEKTKEQREAEMLPKIMQAIELGLAVLDTAFDRINVNEISDSEDEEDISSEGRIILEPKDPYEHRPLPYIIGSEEFMKCDYAGLKDLIEEDASSLSGESSISETDETSSDEGEPLPLDDDQFSEKQHDELSQNISDKVSSSDESELFGSEKDVNGFGSQSSLEIKSKEKNIQRQISVEAQLAKEVRQHSISSLQSKLKLPQVLPVPKLQQKEDEDDGDLFANEGHSDDESLFHKKTGLFVSDTRFKEEKEDDLFGGDLFGKSPSDVVEKVKPAEVPKSSAKEPPRSIIPENKKPALFDNDEDSEDDIFNTLMKTKKPTTSKTSNTSSQDSSKKADTSSTPASTPSSAPSTKPSGNAFDFVTGTGNADSLFGDDSDGDDLFSTKKIQGKKFDFDSTENDDLFSSLTSKPPKESKILGESKSPLFEDKKVLEQPKNKEPEKQILKKKSNSLFEDSDSSDQEKEIPVKSPLSAPVKSPLSVPVKSPLSVPVKSPLSVPVKSPLSVPVVSKKEVNLFGDDELEDDIFSQVNKEAKSNKPVERTKPTSLFDDSEEIKPKESKPQKSVEKPRTTSLFDDTEEETEEIIPNVPKVEQKKRPSLFDDSDNFDLFTPKPSVIKSEPKPVKPTMPVQVSKPSVEVPKAKDTIDETKTTKISSPVKDVSSENRVSFDTPVDSSNVLSVINKSRVKVTAKRRKPTRHGRLAAIENSATEVKTDLKTPLPKPDLGALDNDSDGLFSDSAPKADPMPILAPPKLDHKSQEKKKMNLMSQLISEVAASKVVLKKAADKEEEEEEEEVDIFSEASKKDKSKGSFSFKLPEENGIASVFPIEKSEDKKDSSDVTKSDSFEDDFFEEPAFQNFRSSISHKDPPVLDLGDDEDDDDLFSTIKSNILPKTKTGASDSNDLFDDDTDIFADVQKEKYEMFPSQAYDDDDDDDDIFSNLSNTASNKSSSKTNNSSSIKKVETKQVNAFDDPLTGLLGEE